jgi:hypothetical protein
MTTEVWKDIEGVSGYMVSSRGQVMNVGTDRLLAHNITTGGARTVRLYVDKQMQVHTVKRLVADTFVPPNPTYLERVYIWQLRGIDYAPADYETNPEETSPVLKDGNEDNCSALNIVWRTRSFAWQYKRQFSDYDKLFIHKNSDPLQDVDTGQLYYNVYTCAIENGLLFRDIWACAQGYTQFVQTTDQRFLFVRHLNEKEHWRAK